MSTHNDSGCGDLHLAVVQPELWQNHDARLKEIADLAVIGVFYRHRLLCVIVSRRLSLRKA